MSDSPKIPRTPVPSDDRDERERAIRDLRERAFRRVTGLLEDLERPRTNAGLFTEFLVNEMLSVLEEFAGSSPFTDQQAIEFLEEEGRCRERTDDEIHDAAALWDHFKERAERAGRELVSDDCRPVFQLYERHYFRQLLLDLFLVGVIKPVGQDKHGNHLYRLRDFADFA